MKAGASYFIEDLSREEMNILRYGAFHLCLGYAKSLLNTGVRVGEVVALTKHTTQGKMFKNISTLLGDYYGDKHGELINAIAAEYEAREGNNENN